MSLARLNPFPDLRRRAASARPPEPWLYEQPSLDDLLNDDVIAPVLRRDGLTADDVRLVMRRVHKALRRDLCLRAA